MAFGEDKSIYHDGNHYFRLKNPSRGLWCVSTLNSSQTLHDKS